MFEHYNKKKLLPGLIKSMVGVHDPFHTWNIWGFGFMLQLPRNSWQTCYWIQRSQISQWVSQNCPARKWTTTSHNDLYDFSGMSLSIQGFMGVSENNGTPKSSISIGFSIINHPFWGTTIFGNTLMEISIVPLIELPNLWLGKNPFGQLVFPRLRPNSHRAWVQAWRRDTQNGLFDEKAISFVSIWTFLVSIHIYVKFLVGGGYIIF